MEHFHSDWTFKPITMLHVNAPTDKLRNIAFRIADESPSIMNAILRSLSVIYGSVY